MPAFAIPHGAARRRQLKQAERRHPGSAEHLDAEWSRMAALPCALCGEPISDRTWCYYVPRTADETMAHVTCARADRDQRWAEAEEINDE